jgi:hypothetical protein
MVVNNFNICRPIIGPAKTNSELVIDANTPLAFSVPDKRLKTITRRHTHVIQALRQIKLHKLAQGGTLDTCPFPHMPQPNERFRLF